MQKKLAEANPLFSGFYHIELAADNKLALLAYKTEVLDIDGKAQWDGLAVAGAYGMAFQQECHSVYSSTVQAKLWRNNWAVSNATSPRVQLQQWLQECKRGAGTLSDTPVAAISALPELGEDDTRQVISVTLANATLDWDALCDAHLDSYFGTQAFLTQAKTAIVNLYFDAATFELVGARFTADYNNTTISGVITVSTTDGHSLQDFPGKETLCEGTLYEEWEIIRP